MRAAVKGRAVRLLRASRRIHVALCGLSLLREVPFDKGSRIILASMSFFY
jgi:hypothetical protein